MRSAAASSLSFMTDAAKDIVPPLVHALKDKEAEVRAAAAGALGDFGPDAKEAIKPLISLAKDDDAKVRAAVIGALGRFGDDAKDAVGTVITGLKDEDADVRIAAAHALGRSRGGSQGGGQAADRGLGRQGRRRPGGGRRSLAEHARQRGAAAADQGAEGPGAASSGWAAGALGRFGAEGKEAVEPLIGLLKDKDPNVAGIAAALSERSVSTAAPGPRSSRSSRW